VSNLDSIRQIKAWEKRQTEVTHYEFG